jgi:hypothetical protein
VFVIKKRNVNSNFQQRDKLTELSTRELNYAYQRNGGLGISENSADIGNYRAMGRTIFAKRQIVRAIELREIRSIRAISRHFFSASGIYSRVVRYMANLPSYDYLLTPYIDSDDVRKERLLSDFARALKFLESLNLKSKFGEISTRVLVDGVFYGYLRQSGNNTMIQELPPDYCRSIYKINGLPVIEFNLFFFDVMYSNPEIRMNVLKSMPAEIIEAYLQYKEGNDKRITSKDLGLWIKLDPNYTMRFRLNEDETGIFTSAIPQILDLDDLQAVSKKKAEQQLLKIMIQKIPLDKNGDFIFDMEEAKAMHNNAVGMLARAMNVDVLTTFADSQLLDLEDRNRNATDSERWEKALYNELGVSQQLFATEGNLALEKSVANDESIMMSLILQYQEWLNKQLEIRFNPVDGKYRFSCWFPRITQHNRNEVAKLYKEQASLGYSKVLPALALGQSQANLMATLLFENDILNLGDKMEPVKMASTMSSKDKSSDGAGRPELPDDQKSDKTLANEASGG